MIGNIGRNLEQTSHRLQLLGARYLFATAVVLLIGSTCQADDGFTAPPDQGTETVEPQPEDAGSGEEMGGTIASENGAPDETFTLGEDSSGTGPGEESSNDDETIVSNDETTTDPDGVPTPIRNQWGNGPHPNDYYLMTMTGGLDEPLDESIYYTLNSSPTFSSMAATSNQRAVARGLDRITAQDSDFSVNLTQQLHDLSTPASQQAAFDSLSGEVYGTLQTLGLQVGDRSLRVVTDRIINSDLFLNYGDAMLVSDNRAGGLATSENLIVRGQPSMATRGGWIQGYGNRGNWSGNGNAAAADYSLGGLAYGFDLGHDDTGAIGITAGHSFTSLSTDRSDNGRVTSHQIGLYLVKRIESVYALTVLNYGRNRYDVTRHVHVGGLFDTTQSRFNGDQFGSYSEVGVNLDSPSTRFQPFVGMQSQLLSNSRAYESGGAGLNVAAANLNTLRTHLGGRLVAPALVDDIGIQWTPYFSARWVSDLLGQNPSTFASLNAGPAGASWSVNGNPAGRNFGQFGLGISAQISAYTSLFANYDYQVGARFQSHTGSGGLLWEF